MTIGSRVWLPNAMVTAGVSIGDNVVVAPGSVVTKDVPSGSFAGGTPATVIRENAYPSVPSNRAEILQRICNQAGVGTVVGPVIILNETTFAVDSRIITGAVTPESELLKNHLRRHGIRFHFHADHGVYAPWTDS